jgi:hypothetical protein
MSDSTKVRHRWARCGPKVGTDESDLAAAAPVGGGLSGATPGVATPSGPEAADAAFAWLNRQVSWQSTLAELEGARSPTAVVSVTA